MQTRAQGNSRILDNLTINGKDKFSLENLIVKDIIDLSNSEVTIVGDLVFEGDEIFLDNSKIFACRIKIMNKNCLVRMNKGQLRSNLFIKGNNIIVEGNAKIEGTLLCNNYTVKGSNFSDDIEAKRDVCIYGANRSLNINAGRKIYIQKKSTSKDLVTPRLYLKRFKKSKFGKIKTKKLSIESGVIINVETCVN